MLRNFCRAVSVVIGLLVAHLLGQELPMLVAWYLAFETVLLLWILAVVGQEENVA